MNKLFAVGGFGVAMASALLLQSAQAAEAPRAVPAAMVDAPLARTSSTATAVLAGGCFWGLEGVFEHVAGVKHVVSGYAGGGAATAHYEVVGSGLTGHAESVQVSYDPAKISFGQLLRVYFSVATDPTELNHQEPDTGTQYRGTIFAQTPEQAKIAHAYISQLDHARAYPKPLATTVESGKTFYPAEDYHQNFLARNPDYPYIVAYDLPKVAALKRLFPLVYKG
ncbi:MAG: peptide-methionine (S)-S-oxide reductase MsrA [Janthinobacterium lividum]